MAAQATPTKPTHSSKSDKPTKPEPKITKGLVDENEDDQKGKAKHPLVGSSNKESYPFKSVPADYDFEKHQSLKKKDFVDDGGAAFFDYRAMICDAQAKKFRSKAEEARMTGAAGDDGALLKKAMREAAKLKELSAILGKKGYNLEDLLAKNSAKVDEIMNKNVTNAAAKAAEKAASTASAAK